jgi:hypothetical protein
MMSEQPKTTVKVRFTQQQLELLERLRREGKFGNTYEEVVVSVFRNFVLQEADKGGAR